MAGPPGHCKAKGSQQGTGTEALYWIHSLQPHRTSPKEHSSISWDRPCPCGDKLTPGNPVLFCPLQPVGCDGSLYSPRTMDRCRVCGGDGSTCHRVSGTFRKAISQIGTPCYQPGDFTCYFLPPAGTQGDWLECG